MLSLIALNNSFVCRKLVLCQYQVTSGAFLSALARKGSVAGTLPCNYKVPLEVTCIFGYMYCKGRIIYPS